MNTFYWDSYDIVKLEMQHKERNFHRNFVDSIPVSRQEAGDGANLRRFLSRLFEKSLARQPERRHP